MYIEDLLSVLEKELGLPGDGTISDRETAIIAAVRALKRPAGRRLPAATKDKIESQAHGIVTAMLSGHPVRQVASDNGVSEDQCRKVFAREVIAACRTRSGALQLQGKTRADHDLRSLQWIANGGPSKVLGRARSEPSLVGDALKEYWSIT